MSRLNRADAIAVVSILDEHATGIEGDVPVLFGIVREGGTTTNRTRPQYAENKQYQ